MLYVSFLHESYLREFVLNQLLVHFITSHEYANTCDNNKL